jgi:hypothetical protein
VTVTRAALPPNAVLEQLVVPRNSLFIDLVVWGKAARSPIWGPFRPFFAGHHVAVEFCSGHLSLEMFNSYLGEAQFVRPKRTPPGEGRLFILCNRRPVARLRELAPYTSPGPVAGSWQFDLGPAGQVIIAVATELPAQPGTTALRFTAPKTSQAEYFQRYDDLLNDPTLSAKLRKTILIEERMLNSDSTDPTVVRKARREARSIVDQYKAWLAKKEKRLEAEIKAQGKAEGVAQAVDDLLAAAAQLLPPETVEALRKQRDPVAIALAMAEAAR